MAKRKRPEEEEALEEEESEDFLGETGYSSGKTFWSEWNQAPRCELEALALAILHQHCPSPAANAGVEWWTLSVLKESQDESSEVAWHWDRDYSLERSGVNVHPMLGTVTYLSQGEDSDSAQLSTLTLDVLSSVQRTGEDVMLPPSGGSAWCTVVPPRLGRHLAFDGRFLHGATAPRTRPCRGQRVTFLANIWVGHQPGNASPLPTDLQAFTGPESMRSVDKALSSPFPLPTQAKVVEIAASDEIKNFPLEGGELRVVPPPGGNDLEDDKDMVLMPQSLEEACHRARELTDEVAALHREARRQAALRRLDEAPSPKAQAAPAPGKKTRSPGFGKARLAAKRKVRQVRHQAQISKQQLKET
eukprot:g20344.t1